MSDSLLLSVVFGNSSFTLQCLPNLRKCRLQFSLREMCVPNNRSLVWITTLLGQLASSDLQEITLVIKADNMEDLRALDSECGVRDVHPVRYDDLKALDWTGLEYSITIGRLAALETVIVEGSGFPHLFLTHMQSLYPALRSKIVCK